MIEEKAETFLVRFDHVIAPDILLSLATEETLEVKGTVSIDLDKMLHDFTSGLGLKSVFDSLVEKKVTKEGYFLDIKGIAEACLFIRDYKLHVKAEYRPSKEWWAKPVAILVLGKLLNDFSAKVEGGGITPGFRQEIKHTMQQLRKKNAASLDLRKLFEEQTFYTASYRVFITGFNFQEVFSTAENGIFKINFSGSSAVKTSNKFG